MNIVSRNIEWDLHQEDGTRNIREKLVDDLGNEYIFDYQADNNTDIQAKLNSRIIEEAADGSTP
jgi:hypothetical protein